MGVVDAMAYIGRKVRITVRDGEGKRSTKTAQVLEATYLWMEGPCLITDRGDISLRRVVCMEADMVCGS